MQSYTICLSGPEKSRARAELALEEARVPLLPTDHHNHHWGAKVPTPAGHSVLVVEHPDVDHVVNALDARSKWVLRTHHHAHPAPEPVYDPLAELAYRIAALEAQSPRPPMRGGAVESPAWANQSGSYSAEQTRRAMFVDMARTAANNPGIISGGLASSADCQLTAPASGMSVNVNTGELIIPGNEGGSQGGYYARVSSQTNLSIAAANPSNPRIDLLCGTVSDSGYTEPTGGSGNQWAAQVITGTPTSGATLSNLNGVGSLPGSSLLLGYVLVPASATSIITADIANSAAQAIGQFGSNTYKTLARQPGTIGPSSIAAATYAFGANALEYTPPQAQSVFYLNLPVGTACRVRAEYTTNAVAPGVTFTLGLYPVTPSPGVSGSTNTYTLGTVITGSTVAFATPAASSQSTALSAGFTSPGAGFYCLACNINASTTVNSATDLFAALEVTG